MKIENDWWNNCCEISSVKRRSFLMGHFLWFEMQILTNWCLQNLKLASEHYVHWIYSGSNKRQMLSATDKRFRTSQAEFPFQNAFRIQFLLQINFCISKCFCERKTAWRWHNSLSKHFCLHMHLVIDIYNLISLDWPQATCCEWLLEPNCLCNSNFDYLPEYPE